MAGVLPTDGQPFNLKLTLDCAQGHRWQETLGHPNWYDSVIDGKPVWVHQSDPPDGPVEFHTTGDMTWAADKLRWQFRLHDKDEDVRKVYFDLSDRDETMARLVQTYRGLRVMRVDPWECLVFFILSTRTDIPTTQNRMECIAKKLGHRPSSSTDARHTFPTPCEIDNQGVEALSQMVQLKFGLEKDARVYLAAIWTSAKKLVLDSLPTLPVEKVITELQSLWGVGDKVSNCVALFSLEKRDAFPIDQNIYRALYRLYGLRAGFPEKMPSYVQTPRRKAQKLFGPFAGYASQFLFVHNHPKTKRALGSTP